MSESPKILIVDDNESNLHMMNELLTFLGFRVFLARRGSEALDHISQELPDIILLDVMMPDINGFDIAKKLKGSEQTRHIPIVMVTALGDVQSKVKALESGADDFLTKPVDQTELKARINSLIKVKAYHDQLQEYQRKLEYEVARKTEKIKQALKRIRLASLETIHLLSCAAEYRDNETGCHIRRMSLYVAAVARKMGLSETEVEKLIYAAPMHDIGKIGIPDQILLKPGKLTKEEWEIMKQHTSIGAKILEGSQADFIKIAHEIALTHHEKWDGTGYPNGLKGEEIPISGRIAAVCDVFDALSSKRPYKEPFSIEKSFQIIEEGKGTHFDPKVVEAFFAIKDDIVTIRETHEDEGKSLLLNLLEEYKKDTE